MARIVQGVVGVDPARGPAMNFQTPNDAIAWLLIAVIVGGGIALFSLWITSLPAPKPGPKDPLSRWD